MRRDVELAREAGLDLAARARAHRRRELYDAADELGMLLLQDFPLQWGYARERSAAGGASRRGPRSTCSAIIPSIVVWCAHNEPVAVAIGIDGDSARSRLRYITGQQLPSWNKTVLDRWVKRAFEQADETRPSCPTPASLPHLPLLDGTDSHLYFGWYHGDVRDLDRLAVAVPRMVRFVGVRCPGGAGDGRLHRPGAVARSRLGRLAERHGLQK